MTEIGRIYIIDDDAEVRGAVGSLLRGAGFEVALFGSSDDFMAAERTEKPSCLVLDIRLRGENGLDFQERLIGAGIHMPVILMTGHGNIPMTVRAMKAGALDFLPKPFSEEKLLSVVASALAIDRARLAAVADSAKLHRAYAQLTPREREVMGLVVTGLMNKQVAARMDLSEITVKIHRGKVMRKMAAQSLADLVRMAESLGIRDETIHRFNIRV